MNDPLLAWHFVGEKLRDGSGIPEDGVWLEHTDAVAICLSGLHASESVLHALRYAPGLTLCRVECEDVREQHEDKFVCARRKILWRLDAKDVVLAWSRRVASDVLHLWDAPEVVKSFLLSGEDAAVDGVRAADAAARAADAAHVARAAYGARAARAAARTADAVARTADAADAVARAAVDGVRAADAAARTADAAGEGLQKYARWLEEMVDAERAATR